MTPRPPRGHVVVVATLLGLLATLAPVLGPALTVPAQAATDARKKYTIAAPRHLRTLDKTPTRLALAWSRPRGAELFRLSYATRSDRSDARVKWTRRARFTLTGLRPETAYHVRVRVVDGQRPVSRFSRTKRFRTVSTTAPPPSPDPETPPPSPDPETPPPSPDPETPPPAPDPETPATTLFGANYTTNSLVDESLYGGRARVARVFFQQLAGVRFSRNSAVAEAMADGVDTFVISWKDTNPEAIRTFLAGIPDGLTVYTSFNHEPENDHGSPGSEAYRAWSEEYRRQWALQSPLMRAEGMIPTNILMAWTLVRSSGRDIAEWTPPAGTVDVFAFDAYYGKGKDPASLVARMAEAARDAGVERTGLAETGAPANDGTRLANTREMRQALLAAGVFEWGIYWNSAESGYDSRLDQTTADAWFGS